MATATARLSDIRWLVLDAMGVIYRAGDDVVELLIPCLRGEGCRLPDAERVMSRFANSHTLEANPRYTEPAVVYTPDMRRIQLYMEPDIDDALTAAAAKRGMSRSALMRDAVRTLLDAESPQPPDPLDSLIGRFDVEPTDDIDAVIYGYDTST